MPQLRQDRFTKEWVFVATECVKHPHDLVVKGGEKRLAAFDPHCPFCPGNEDQTPPEVLRIPAPSKCGWTVRVVPSRFKGLGTNTASVRMVRRSLCAGEGFAIHEVIRRDA
jgi:UDPglucose--hexose-1-phosphate uridylyltransferase